MDEGKEKLDQAHDNLLWLERQWMRLRGWWERRHGHADRHGHQQQGRHP